MPEFSIFYISIIVIFIAILTTLFHKKVNQWQISKNRKKGVKGEVNAEKWLRKHGFKNINPQVSINSNWIVNNRRTPFTVRPDIFADKDGEEWLIEVKTGKVASISNSKTRRQIREYANLFPEKKCALFDATNRKFYAVDFNIKNKNYSQSNIQLFGSLITGVIFGLFLGYFLSKIF